MTAADAFAQIRRLLPGSRPSSSNWTRLLEGVARFGYGARGFVYFSVGLIALLAAIDRAQSPVGSRGVFRTLADQPFALVWLTALGLGLFGFVAWRVLQAFADADHEGVSPKGLAKRAGQAISGVFYAALGWSVFELLDELGERNEPEEAAELQTQAQSVLALPFGGWLLIAVGLVVVGVGIGNIVQGLRNDFAGSLRCTPQLCRRVVPLARAGYVARGFAYLPLGAYVIVAGLHARASEVQSLSGALQSLERQPLGTLVLGLTAAGLMAFGAFAFVEARFRHIRVPADLTP